MKCTPENGLNFILNCSVLCVLTIMSSSRLRSAFDNKSIKVNFDSNLHKKMFGGWENNLDIF